MPKAKQLRSEVVPPKVSYDDATLRLLATQNAQRRTVGHVAPFRSVAFVDYTGVVVIRDVLDSGMDLQKWADDPRTHVLSVL